MLAADDVASIIVARSGPWTDAMSLQKLLYYVQAWHLAVTDEPLFDEQIKAWKDGPVVPGVWHTRRDKASRRASVQVLENDIDEDVSDLIDLVLTTYGSMSADELSALTHVEKPWLEARGDLPDDAPSSKAIERSTMAEFYRADRRLGGRTAADLAASGTHLRDAGVRGPAPVQDILASLDDDLADPGHDPRGGANLVASDASRR